MEEHTVPIDATLADDEVEAVEEVKEVAYTLKNATKEEKKQLMFETRLLEHQITQYLSNYRRRRLPKNNIKFKRSKYNMKNNPKGN